MARVRGYLRVVGPGCEGSDRFGRRGAPHANRARARADWRRQPGAGQKLFTSNTYYDWVTDHVFLFIPAQDYVGKLLATFKEYPQRQKGASFNLDDVLQKLKESPSK